MNKSMVCRSVACFESQVGSLVSWCVHVCMCRYPHRIYEHYEIYIHAMSAPVSQDYIRGTSGGHDYDHQLVLTFEKDATTPSTALVTVCPKLKLQCTMWAYDHASQPQHVDYLQWAAHAIDKGHPVILGVYWGVEVCSTLTITASVCLICWLRPDTFQS